MAFSFMVPDLLFCLGSENEVCACSTRRSPLLATCLWAVAGWRQRGGTPAPSSRPPKCVCVCAGSDSWDHSCSPQPHTWGPCDMTGENKPCSTAKLAETPPSPSRVQFSEPHLHSNYFSGKARGVGLKKTETEQKMYSNKKNTQLK